MTPDDPEETSATEPSPSGATRLAGSGDAVTVVGGSRAPSSGKAPGPGRPTHGDSGSGSGGARPSTESAAPAPAGRRGPLQLAVAIAVVGFALAGVFLGLYLTKSSSPSSSTGGPTAAALRSAANQFATALFTFDATTLNQNINQAQALATPAYAQKISSFYTPDQVAAAKTAQASSRADIKSVYIENIEGDGASVYVSLTDTYANNKDPKPTVDQVRMILSFQRQSGSWKVSDVQVLQAPPAAGAPDSGITSG